ncbi:MAG: TlpA disulfide reductase family protein [Proteobacteria bacterium]|nr:TlpA disulfide reductase family protein [Pseudomonadota bacterium]
MAQTRSRLLTGLAVVALAGALAAGLLLRPGGTPTVDSALVESAYPLVTGQVQNFLLESNPEPAPDITFAAADGSARTLGHFRGEWVLLNLWATWCGPCRREMPSLDRLQALMAGEVFEVVALSQDRTGIDDVAAFYAELGLESLDLYIDETARSQYRFGVTGLPATVLLDPSGYVVGRIAGPAEWDSPEAIALFRHFLTGGGAP